MKHFDHVIVGMGMSALGVLEAISRIDSISILVVDIKDSQDEIYENNNVKYKFGKVGGGGNSDLWHGVISKINSLPDSEYFKTFDLLLKIYYPNQSFSISDNLSFIPYKPLRPKNIIRKKFKDKVSILFDSLIYFKYKDSYIDLIFKKDKITTGTLWLCTGSQGTLKVLNESNLLKEKEYYLDEHLVGYFGQIENEKTKQCNDVIFSQHGHLKPFFTIKQEGSRSMYLNVRPAHFRFKNLEYASRFRNFFGQSSKEIIFKLFSLLNLGLFFEAFYNKFGIAFSSSVYNIVGHIEIEKAVKYNVSENSFSLNTDNVILTNTEAQILTSIFGIHFKPSNVVHLSPGLHLINLDKPFGISYIDDDLISPIKANSSVFICSGVSLKLKSPVHPTFSLLVYSYLKAKNFIQRQSLNGNS